jgi:excisionase family DNA binding protein
VTGPLLTAREVADHLGVSPETVLRWTRRGELPAIRLPGGVIRYHEDVLDGWLAERATPCRGASTTPADAARAEACQNLPETTRLRVSTTPEVEE